MPPKAKITKEMILDAAFTIAREEGADKITARKISEKLGCSTQPVLYHYATVDEIKRETYKVVDEYHTNYIMNNVFNMENDDENPLLMIGLNYIRFAREESNLFQFLFQSNELCEQSMTELMDAEELAPMLLILQQELHMGEEDVKTIFSILFIFVHGYASLYANNSMGYNEKDVIAALNRVFVGTVCAINQEKEEGYDDEKNI